MLRFWSVRISLLAVLLLVLGPLLAFIGVLPGLPASLAFALAGLVGFVGLVAGIVTALRGGMRPGVVAMVLGAACLLTVVLPVFTAGGRPPINDIATDLEAIPAFTHAAGLPENRGRDLAYPEAFKPLVKQFYPRLGPMRLEVPPDVLFEQALAVARAQPRWEVTHVDAQARTFEGVARTRIFNYRDDFIVRVRPEGTGSRMDMRSKSRVGRGDLGANAKRIEAFFADVARAMSK
jgi:uncharacterized protein (DUF1499 family)